MLTELATSAAIVLGVRMLQNRAQPPPEDKVDAALTAWRPERDAGPQMANVWAAGIPQLAHRAPPEGLNRMNDSSLFADPFYAQRYKELIIGNIALESHDLLSGRNNNQMNQEHGLRHIQWHGARGEQNFSTLMMRSGLEATNQQIPASHFRKF